MTAGTDFKSILKKVYYEIVDVLYRFITVVVAFHFLGYFAFGNHFRSGELATFGIEDLVASVVVAISLFLTTLFLSNATDKKLDAPDILNFILGTVSMILSIVVTYFAIEIFLKDNFRLIFQKSGFLPLDQALFVWGILFTSGVFSYNSDRAESLNRIQSRTAAKPQSASTAPVSADPKVAPVVVTQLHPRKGSGQQPVANQNPAAVQQTNVDPNASTKRPTKHSRSSTQTGSLPQDSGVSVPYVVITPQPKGQSRPHNSPSAPKKGPSNP